MDVLDIFAAALCIAFVANFVHWAATRRGPFWWFPTGWPWNACVALIAVASVSAAAGLMPRSWLPLVMTPVFLFQQLGSIWVRHTARPVA